MLNNVTRLARWADLWLRKNFGRPYESLLVLGLVLSIVASVNNLEKLVAADAKGLTTHLVETGASVVFQLALLINQLAQLDVARAKRRRRKLRAGGRDPAAAASVD